MIDKNKMRKQKQRPTVNNKNNNNK